MRLFCTELRIQNLGGAASRRRTKLNEDDTTIRESEALRLSVVGTCLNIVRQCDENWLFPFGGSSVVIHSGTFSPNSYSLRMRIAYFSFCVNKHAFLLIEGMKQLENHDKSAYL